MSSRSNLHFYCGSICEGGLGSRNSVRLSVTHMDCDKTKWHTVDILIPYERAITLVLWRQQWLVGDAPCPLKSALKVTHLLRKRRLRPISAYSVSPVRGSEKSSIMTNIKLTTGFPTSYRWSAYVTPKSRTVDSKSDFFRFLNITELQSNKVCDKVSLCVNLQRQSCRTTFLCLMVHRY